MHWYLDVLKKYATFSGRARRKEYWTFVLINIVVAIIFGGVEVVLFVPGLVSGLYGLALLVPSLAVGVRRLHDTGRSGWWLLISFVPLVGGIILLVFLVQDSEQGTNDYGPNPKDYSV